MAVWPANFAAKEPCVQILASLFLGLVKVDIILQFSKHQLSHKKNIEAVNITSIRGLLWELNQMVYSECIAEYLADI